MFYWCNPKSFINNSIPIMAHESICQNWSKFSEHLFFETPTCFAFVCFNPVKKLYFNKTYWYSQLSYMNTVIHYLNFQVKLLVHICKINTAMKILLCFAFVCFNHVKKLYFNKLHMNQFVRIGQNFQNTYFFKQLLVLLLYALIMLKSYISINDTWINLSELVKIFRTPIFWNTYLFCFCML